MSRRTSSLIRKPNQQLLPTVTSPDTVHKKLTEERQKQKYYADWGFRCKKPRLKKEASTSGGRRKSESTRRTQKLDDIGRYHHKETQKQILYVVENEKRAYRRNSQHLAPQHQPTLSQIQQSDQSITETPSDNESHELKKIPDLKSSQAQPRGSDVIGET